MPNENGWNEWSKYVLKELERLNECVESMNKKIDKISIDTEGLKIKASVWGAVGGAIPVLITILVAILIKYGGR